MPVSFSPEIKSHMRETFDFIAVDNPVRARTFIKELRGAASEIGNHPLRYAPLLGYPNIRKRSYKGYVILYEIVDDGINILHILNSMRDYASLIKRKNP